MRTSVTSQQAAFFTQNGYIELAGIHFKPEEVFSAARSAPQGAYGRDLWRHDPSLRHLALRKLAPPFSSSSQSRPAWPATNGSPPCPSTRHVPSANFFRFKGSSFALFLLPQKFRRLSGAYPRSAFLLLHRIREASSLSNPILSSIGHSLPNRPSTSISRPTPFPITRFISITRKIQLPTS